ncbi:predicted protein [Sclerotinia sclerotiorum 1980 UF-70]|uniref:Uncharacterized protein n=1 Tax=Sclerotinia sclerotiorum (strain ATCC 18683 / 1980 / Ss-1) TaxID=665079 RepID=A7EX80_SCLS1|nr:predicted protein [Sclerotinia sclerotiorum 1980 UF-70]EDN94072.1 predicted protein [Sclerotinia sclerotiorum 1980 UF-70]
MEESLESALGENIRTQPTSIPYQQELNTRKFVANNQEIYTNRDLPRRMIGKEVEQIDHEDEENKWEDPKKAKSTS